MFFLFFFFLFIFIKADTFSDICLFDLYVSNKEILKNGKEFFEKDLKIETKIEILKTLIDFCDESKNEKNIFFEAFVMDTKQINKIKLFRDNFYTIKKLLEKFE